MRQQSRLVGMLRIFAGNLCIIVMQDRGPRGIDRLSFHVVKGIRMLLRNGHFKYKGEGLSEGSNDEARDAMHFGDKFTQVQRCFSNEPLLSIILLT